MVAEKAKRERSTQGMHKENIPQGYWLRKRKGLNFLISCNQCLKPGVLKVSRLVWDTARMALCCSWRKGRQTTQGQTL